MKFLLNGSLENNKLVPFTSPFISSTEKLIIITTENDKARRIPKRPYVIWVSAKTLFSDSSVGEVSFDFLDFCLIASIICLIV